MPTMQHQILFDIVQERLSAAQKSPWENRDDLMADIESSIRNVREGESIVVDLGSGRCNIAKVAGFDDLHTISRDAIIISYKELNEAFHETYLY